MHFFHLSDLHIGKQLYGYSLLEDQEWILTEIYELIREKRPDGVLIAGDVYDKSVPAAEAVTVFDRFLTKVSQMCIRDRICIGQGYRGKTGTLGIGSCTRGFASCLQGCPPTDEEIYQFLKKCIQEKEERI